VEADNKPVQTVASATRNTSTGRKQNRIELTPSEQALAKKLGVSFKDYAIQKARLERS
jgi:phage I-like protein